MTDWISASVAIFNKAEIISVSDIATKLRLIQYCVKRDLFFLSFYILYHNIDKTEAVCNLDPVVQSSLRDQLVKCFKT